MSVPIVSFITTTSYGTWLPGDARGYVEHGQVLPPNPDLHRHSRGLMAARPVYFSSADQLRLLTAFREACDEFIYRPLELSIESWHMHWTIRHADAPAIMVGRLKNRMRQALGRGRIWTEGYCCQSIETDDALETIHAYIRDHAGWRPLA